MKPKAECLSSFLVCLRLQDKINSPVAFTTTWGTDTATQCCSRAGREEPEIQVSWAPIGHIRHRPWKITRGERTTGAAQTQECATSRSQGEAQPARVLPGSDQAAYSHISAVMPAKQAALRWMRDIAPETQRLTGLSFVILPQGTVWITASA